MRHNRIWVCAIAFAAAALLITAAAHAYVTRNMSALNVVLESPDLQRILKVKIISIEKPGGRVFPGPLTFRVNVLDVIYGDLALKGQNLDLSEAFTWPENLLPMAEDQKCILVFDKYGLADVVPARSAEIGHIEKGSDAKPLLLKEILAELKADTTPLRQRLLILLGCPIMGESERPTLVPFLDSKDEWLRRAALAGLVDLTRDQKYVKMAVDDVRTYLRSHTVNQRLQNYESWGKGSGYHPYYAFFEYYSFLNFRYPRDEAKLKALPLLPLFRVVAEELKDDRDLRVQHGLGALYHYGAVEDLPIIFADHANSDPHIRAVCLSAAARILGLKLTYTNDADFQQHEQEWQDAVAAGIRQLPKQ